MKFHEVTMLKKATILFFSVTLAGCFSRGPGDFIAYAPPDREPRSNKVLTGLNIGQPVEPSEPARLPAKQSGYVRVFTVSLRGDDSNIPRPDEEKFYVNDLEYNGNLTFSINSKSIPSDMSGIANEIRFNSDRYPQDGHDVILFVHGYNNGKADALERTAQVSGFLEHEERFHGTTISFDWWSLGQTTKYPYDLQSANFARDNLSWLLYGLASDRNVRHINIVAHSMGCWLTMEALRQTAFIGAERSFVLDKIFKINLVEADIDEDVFDKQMNVIRWKYTPTRTFPISDGLLPFSQLPPFPQRIRVFANPNDKALAASQWMSDAPRLGNLRADEFKRRFGQDSEYKMSFTPTDTASTQIVADAVAAIKKRISSLRRSRHSFNLIEEVRQWSSRLAKLKEQGLDAFVRHWPIFDPRIARAIASEYPPDSQPNSVAQANR